MHSRCIVDGSKRLIRRNLKLALISCALENKLRSVMLSNRHRFWSAPPLAVPNLVVRGLEVRDSSAPYQTM